MRMRLGLIMAVLTCFSVALSGIAAAAPQSQSSAPTRLPPAAISNPEVPIDVIMALPEVIREDGAVRIDPDLDPNVPIVDAKGRMVPGQSSTAMRASCSTGVYGPPGFWSGAVDSTCSVWGSPGFKLTYRFSLQPGLTNPACGQATGWNASYQEFWAGLGCGSTGYAQVDWGNVIAQPKVSRIHDW